MTKEELIKFFHTEKENVLLNTYLALAKVLIEHFNLKNDDPRIVVNARQDRFSFPITINSRYVINTAFNDSISFIMPPDVETKLTEKWGEYIKYDEFKSKGNVFKSNRNEIFPPTWWRIPQELIPEFLNECRDLWFAAVDHELQSGLRSQFKKFHQPELFDLIMNGGLLSTLEERLTTGLIGTEEAPNPVPSDISTTQRRTFLYPWNPKRKEDFWDIPGDKRKIEKNGSVHGIWRSKRKDVSIGDRIFVMRLGDPVIRGIIASGVVSGAASGLKSPYLVPIEFDVLQDVDSGEPYLHYDQLKEFGEMHWFPESGGSLTPSNIAIQVEQMWSKIVGERAPLLDLNTTTVSGTDDHVSNVGAGFGRDSEKNREVERKAVDYVRNYFEEIGWSVKSVELEKDKGFDLLCTKGDLEERVEVKGVSGSDPSFIITANELRKAETDSLWKIHIVYCLDSNSPKHDIWSGTEFIIAYLCKPIQYQAKRVI